MALTNSEGGVVKAKVNWPFISLKDEKDVLGDRIILSY